MMTKMRTRMWIALIVLLAGSTSLWADGSVTAITRPSEDVTLSFVRPGQVKKVLVKEGDTVKAGRKLVQLDDAAEQFQLAQLKAQAENDIHIKAAKAQLDYKRVDLQKLQQAAEKGAAANLEIELARLDVTIADLSLGLAKFRREQDKRKYQEAKLQVERMQLKSPISGKVERILAKAGESVDALEKVIWVVDVDTLRIDVPVPLERARSLKPGQSAGVAFDKAGKQTARGRIVHVASVADAASDTLNVRVELANPTGRPAGERVYVSFPGPRSNAETGTPEPIRAARDGAPPTNKE